MYGTAFRRCCRVHAPWGVDSRQGAGRQRPPMTAITVL